MELRRLGHSGLQVSAIGLGCNNFGNSIDQAQTTAVVDAAIEAGVIMFDTAELYGDTRSELFLGTALGARRKEVVIATKFGIRRGGPRPLNSSRAAIVEACEGSLKRLGTDYIDLYQVHRPDPDTPMEETLRALDDLVSQGKVRYIGGSNFAAWQIADADGRARALGAHRFISAQSELSLLSREVEAEVLPACAHFGLGFLPYFPLASGLLSGKYRRGEPPQEGARLHTWGAKGEALMARNFDKVDALSDWVAARGKTLLELAFAWVLAHPEVSSVIAGATKPEQVRANAATVGWRLSAAELAELNALTA